MTLYTHIENLPVKWSEPIEETWHKLGSGADNPVASKMPHLNISDLLFIAAVVNIPRASRPWGVITWLADVFRISRVSVYAIGARIARGLQGPASPGGLVAPAPEPDQGPGQIVSVTPSRLARTILTATFPGNVSIRPTQQLVQEALGQSRSVGFISQLRLESGRKAGALLGQLDYSALGPVIVVRDETFFQGYPILIIIDPVSTTVLWAQVCPDRQAATWAQALAQTQAQGTCITGLIEDMARTYPKSQQLAGLKDVAVQKDPWHVQRDGARVRQYLERAAYQAMRKVLAVEEQLRQAWDAQVFEEQYVPWVHAEEQRIAQHDSYAQCLEHLYDALELVDWRSGEIREPQTNAWLLEQVLTALEQLEPARIRKFVKTLRNHQKQLLTFLDWTARAMGPYRQQLQQHIAAPREQERFIRTVARWWRLRQAVINGQSHWQAAADATAAVVRDLIAADETRAALTTQLLHLLDAAGHTSSLVENINGILKSFLLSRQSFRNLETLQAYLNLFTLWHNMRVYERGKRQGSSPYQLAGIDPGSDDWLELLGYPAS